MAAASPTPLASYSNGGRISRQSSMHSSLHQSRRESPMSLLGQSHGFTANAPMMQRIDIGDSSDEDEIEAPMKLNPYTRALLGQDGPSSPDRQARGPPKLRISRNSLGHTSDTPMQDSITPAPSLRIKRVPLRGAPMRRLRRTPQGDDDQQQPSIIDDNMSMQQAGSPHARSPPRAGSPRIVRITSPSQDQENINAAHAKAESVMRVNSSSSKVDSMMKDASLKDSVMKSDRSSRPSSNHDHKPAPLAPVSVNTPLRPAPPPPPKMSVLETATSAAGASTVKQKKRRRAFMVNGKPYQEIGRIGKGGSSDVYRVMAENGKLFALKRVKLEDADENAVRGYKGEIDLLRKLEGVERVVRLFDWEVDEEKQILSVLMDIGESDLARILRMKIDPEDARLDLSFTRYYWKEMLECVASVHEHDIVHSDLKPANFLLIQGRLKLIDFGIANAIDIEHTVNVHRDSHVGTPNYMSPESLQDANAGARHGPHGDSSLGRCMKLGKPSDVWSLGCILYQMVYGRPPFAHIANQIHRVMAIVNPNVGIEFPSHGLGDVRIPVGLRRTLKRCLLRDPSRRPTIPEMLSERDEFLYPDAGDDLKIPEALLGQIIQRVADRFRDQSRPMPSEDEIRQYPSSFYAKIRDLMDEV
ncbi:kinase-like domain-containing protein [Phyllosticta capitalensis]|uniref:Kinase-like domain-containing protein n=1 Tax=Phyllosticta capitalensis TaxID=121624 RepID=A0ABR1YDZ3_9PEZI